MNAKFQALVTAATEAQREAVRTQAALDTARRQCNHQWSKAAYTPIRTAGYMTRNLMGHFTVNQDGSVNAPEVYIPPTETPKWTRTCTECGLDQITDKTEQHVTSTPKF